MKSFSPTDKQKNALRKFRIKDDEIAKMDFDQASTKLNEIISKLPPKKTITITPSNTPALSSKGETNPNTLGRPSITVPKKAGEPANSLASQAAVQERIKHAKEILKKEVPDAESWDGYNLILAEILHQLQSERWLELEEKKRR